MVQHARGATQAGDAQGELKYLGDLQAQIMEIV
jgi:hypothetical protein